jgi:hypothetical protein
VIFAHLIQAASSLPTDVSALQSSISVLESAISALERDASILEMSSVFWERWPVWISDIFVLLGVAMELWVIRHEYRDDMEAWARTYFGIPWFPDRPSIAKLLVEVSSVLLITMGITGELGIGIKIASTNGRLRAKSSELRSKNADLRSESDQLLALVNQQAGEARTSAELADKSAGQAQNKANVVSTRTDKLTQELTKDENGISELEAKRAELEKSLINLAICNAPRVIPFWSVGNTKTSSDPLKPFAGRQAIIEFVPDAEARRAALSIYGSLDRAGWKIIRISPLDGLEDGVEIQPYIAPLPTSEFSPEWQSLWQSEIRSGEAADAVIDFLHSYNWQAKRGWPVDENGHMIRDTKILPPDTLRIRVGLYPSVTYVSPPGAKDLADAIARGDQQREAIKKQMDKEQADRDEEVLKHLTPQRASEYRARMEQWNKEREQLIDRISGPCQPLNSLTPLLR